MLYGHNNIKAIFPNVTGAVCKSLVIFESPFCRCGFSVCRAPFLITVSVYQGGRAPGKDKFQGLYWF